MIVLSTCGQGKATRTSSYGTLDDALVALKRLASSAAWDWSSEVFTVSRVDDAERAHRVEEGDAKDTVVARSVREAMHQRACTAETNGDITVEEGDAEEGDAKELDDVALQCACGRSFATLRGIKMHQRTCEATTAQVHCLVQADDTDPASNDLFTDSSSDDEATNIAVRAARGAARGAGSAVFTCSDCSRSFTSSRGIAVHRSRFCAGKAATLVRAPLGSSFYACDFCGYACRSEALLNAHVPSCASAIAAAAEGSAARGGGSGSASSSDGEYESTTRQHYGQRRIDDDPTPSDVQRCRCGSSTHKRASHKSCPLNLKAQKAARKAARKAEKAAARAAKRQGKAGRRAAAKAALKGREDAATAEAAEARTAATAAAENNGNVAVETGGEGQQAPAAGGGHSQRTPRACRCGSMGEFILFTVYILCESC